jgi:hypothetical protein
MAESWGKVPISAFPRLPSAQVSRMSSGAVKVATPDLIIDRLEDIPYEIMRQLVFEGIGGQEILTIARHDLINGQKVSYSPIKNLQFIQSRFNSTNIISLSATPTTIFQSFAIKFEDKLPLPGRLDDGSYVVNLGTGPSGEHVYQDSETGSIVINVRNMARDEEVEVQIASAVQEFSGTIY